jgi:creatinine amidohydrolase
MREVLYTVRGPKTLPEMSWVEVEAALRQTSIVVVPLGSTEQHGPHMPLGVDALLGVELSRRVVERLGQEGFPVVAGPTIPFGASPNMEELGHPFPGTVSLRLSTLIAVIRDVCRALYEHGFRKIVLVATHAENHGPAQVAAKELVEELPESEVLYLAFGPVTAEKHRAIVKTTPPSEDGHAGEAETGRMLATHPELVDLTKLDRPGVPKRAREPIEHSGSPFTGGGLFRAVRNTGPRTSLGYYGSPQLATAETGEKSFEAIVDWVCRIIKRDLAPR